MNRDRRLKYLVNAIVLTLSFYGVSKREVDFKEASVFESVLIGTFAPIQQSVKYVNDKVQYFLSTYITNINASDENIELKSQLKKAKAKITALAEIERENRRLKDFLSFGQDKEYKKILAQVVAWNSSSDYRVLRINKGSDQNVQLQAAVVTADGVVGYVYRLTNQFADVLTILDANNRIDAMIRRTRSHGIVEGDSNGRLLMKYVTRTEPVILRDAVITSGLGNIYPKGLPIGRVSRIERIGYGITQDIKITPSVNFTTLEEVIVLAAPENKTRKLEWEALDQQEGKRGGE